MSLTVQVISVAARTTTDKQEPFFAVECYLPTETEETETGEESKEKREKGKITTLTQIPVRTFYVWKKYRSFKQLTLHPSAGN